MKIPPTGSTLQNFGIMASLIELDALEVLVIVDNEVDPISTYPNPAIKVSGQFMDIATRSPTQIYGRADAEKELRMDNICCGAHGLSLMVVSNIACCIALIA